jgi:phosphohistidine phosphatase
MVPTSGAGQPAATPSSRTVAGMHLHLVRHGQATSEQDDPERGLTDEGAAAVADVARHGVERLGVRATRVLHSGKARARETAEIWAGLLDAKAEQADGLAPNDDPAVWADRLPGEKDDLMLVGHLPHLGRLAALLVSGVDYHRLVVFKAGQLVSLERDGSDWVISVAVPPEGPADRSS